MTGGRDYEAQHAAPALPDAVLALRGTATPVFSDALVILDVQPHVVHGLFPLELSGPGARLFGRAVTVGYGAADPSRTFSKAPFIASGVVRNSEPGDVVVLAAGGAPYSFFGDHMARMATQTGMDGALVDGSVRDADGIVEAGVPVFCSGRSPEPFLNRYEAVTLNEPVDIRGVTISGGDLIVADGDGVVVVPRAHFEETARIVGELLELERWVGDALAAGMHPDEMYAGSDRRRSEIRQRVHAG